MSQSWEDHLPEDDQAADYPPPPPNEPDTSSPAEGAEPGRARWVRATPPMMLLLLGGLVGLLLGGIIGAGAVWFLKDSPAEQAVAAQEEAQEDALHGLRVVSVFCSESEFQIGDEGRTLTLTTVGKENPLGASFATLDCVLQAIQAPEHVRKQMESTRALDGTREATWGAYRAIWNYHPDSGMNLTITIDAPAPAS